MICKTCARAADAKSPDMHSLCKGCDCHHMVITGSGTMVPSSGVRKSPAESVGLLKRCEYCDELMKVRKDGQLRKHRVLSSNGTRLTCMGSGF
jgi:hypothetical protein